MTRQEFWNEWHRQRLGPPLLGCIGILMLVSGFVWVVGMILTVMTTILLYSADWLPGYAAYVASGRHHDPVEWVLRDHGFFMWSIRLFLLAMIGTIPAGSLIWWHQR